MLNKNFPEIIWQSGNNLTLFIASFFEVTTMTDEFKQMIDHRSYVLNLSSWENKAWKNSGLDGIQTHDLCDTGTVL